MNQLKYLVKANFFDDKSRMHLMVDTGIPYERILETADTKRRI